MAKKDTTAKELIGGAAKSILKGVIEGEEFISDKARIAKDKTVELAEKTQKSVVQAMDQDGNGEIDSADLIMMALKVPGVRINRAEFLKKELFKNHTDEEINKAIETTPVKAGIPSEEVDKIAKEVIKFERNAVSGISTALGMPGGVAMLATIPADIAQYYGYMLRAAQKLLYLYGFPEMNLSEGSVKLDS